MDARAMEDHDWDECGDEIAKLFEGDKFKRMSIADAWWCDLDEEEQALIHEYVCEDKRTPDALEAAQRFEKYAAEREKKYRERAERRAAEEATAAPVKAGVDPQSDDKNPKVQLATEYEKFMALLHDATAGTDQKGTWQ